MTISRPRRTRVRARARARARTHQLPHEHPVQRHSQWNVSKRPPDPGGKLKVVAREHVPGAALVDGHRGGGLLDLGNDLGSRSAGTDDSHALPLKVRVGRPVRGVPISTFEALDAGDVKLFRV